MKTIVESDFSTPLVTFHLDFVGGGAVHDPAERSGLASFATDLLPRGTAGLSAHALAAKIDRLGAAMHVGVGRECAVVTVNVIPQNVGAMVEVLKQVLAAPAFLPEEVEKLRQQARAELLGHRDHDGYLARRAFRRSLFAGHPYARSTGGDDAGIAGITLDEIRAFHAETFVQARAVVAISGAISPTDGEVVAENLCAALPAGKAPPAATMDPAPQRGRHLILVDKPDRGQVSFMLGQLGVRFDDPDQPAMHVGTTIFGGGGFHSRLMRELRTVRGWTYGVNAGFGMSMARGDFFLACAVAERDAPDALRLQLDLLEDLAAHGVTEDELRFAKGHLAGASLFERDTAQKRASARASEVVYGLPEGYFARYVEMIDRVSLDEVNAAIRARVDPQHLVIAAVATHRSVGAQLGAAVPGVSTVTTTPFDAA